MPMRVAHEASLRARVIADLDPDEHLVIPDADAFARDVVALVQGVWQDTSLRQALASPAARFEVPIVFRHEEAGMVRLVRGTMDCLVPDDAGAARPRVQDGSPTAGASTAAGAVRRCRARHAAGHRR